jgi:hypothetical protein
VHADDEVIQQEELGPGGAERETLGQEREGALEPGEEAPVRPDEGSGDGGGAPAH